MDKTMSQYATKDDFIAALQEEIEELRAKLHAAERLVAAAKEFDESGDDAEWEPPHPIFALAEENDSLRAKLAKYEEAEKQEPVATALGAYEGDEKMCSNFTPEDWQSLHDLPAGTKLYARPAPIPGMLTELKHIYAKMTNCESFGGDGEVRGQMVPHALLDELGEMLAASIPEGYVLVPKERETGGWIWCWLMDYVREMGVSPDRQARLFRLVSDYRAMLTAAEEGE